MQCCPCTFAASRAPAESGGHVLYERGLQLLVLLLLLGFCVRVCVCFLEQLWDFLLKMKAKKKTLEHNKERRTAGAVAQSKMQRLICSIGCLWNNLTNKQIKGKLYYYEV